MCMPEEKSIVEKQGEKVVVILRTLDDGTKHIFDTPVNPDGFQMGIHFVQTINGSLTAHLDRPDAHSRDIKYPLEGWEIRSGLGMIFAISGNQIESTAYDPEIEKIDIVRGEKSFILTTDKGDTLEVAQDSIEIKFTPKPFSDTLHGSDSITIEHIKREDK